MRSPFSIGERCGTGRMKRERAEIYQQHRQRNTPTPLPGKRSRRLSLPSNRTSELRNDRAESSPLLRLPAEIRELIWGSAMGGRTLHITSGESVPRQPRFLDIWKSSKSTYRHGFVDCSPINFSVMPENPPWAAPLLVDNEQVWLCAEDLHCPTCAQFFDGDGFGEWQRVMRACQVDEYDVESELAWEEAKKLERQRSPDRWNPLAVLQTCRMIYRESLPHLYSNTFVLLNEQQAVDWPTTLLPSTRELAKSIEWKTFWTSDLSLRDIDYDISAPIIGIAKFRRLKHLSIDCASESQLYGSADVSGRFDSALLKLGEQINKNGGEIVIRLKSSRDPVLAKGATGIRVVVRQ